MSEDQAGDTTVYVSASTSDSVLGAGLALVHAAEESDSGGWKAVIDWMGANPHLAAELAQHIADAAGVGRLLTRQNPTDRVGRWVGGYEILSELGRGGMGVVYRARDHALNRDVAVKLLRADGGFTAVEAARFRYEAEVVASLKHSNIVTVLAYGETDGGPYLVMPLMAGGSMAAWLKRRTDDKVAPKRAAEMLRDVALGVHHAHQRGLIHRDLKPGNLLLDADDTPHVADFGLARRLDATLSTAAGIAGTVAYMAPEQGRGERQLTTAADLYALGVILFELLTGKVPYADSDVPGILLRLTDEDEPVPPVSQRRPDVPADLAAVCAKCLEKRPADRYSSALELAEDLVKFLAGEPINHSQRGWFTGLTRALGWRRELPSMGSWWAPLCGAVSTFAALGVIQIAVLCGAPPWLGWAAMGYYLTAWLLLVRLFQALGPRIRNPVEKASAALQYGMALASAAVIAVQLSPGGGSIEACFQPFCAIVGLGVFAHGVFYWGGMYAAGMAFMAFAAVMPLYPVRYWPGTYGAVNVAFQLWVGFHLLRVHRQGRSVSTSDIA